MAARPEPLGRGAGVQPAGANVLEVEDLRVGFRVDRRQVVEAVKGVSFAVGRQRTVALVGESGSGKSVSAMSIVGLLPPNAVIGERSRVLYDGRDLLACTPRDMQDLRGKDVAVVFQEPMTSLNPVFTVGDQVAEMLRRHTGLSARQAATRAVELLNEVGVPNPQLRVRSYPHELSGGQQQRAMIAMAIACEPRLLIADEPTTALDVTIQRQIVELLASLRDRHHMSMLFITHDLGLVGEIADHVVVMRNGEVMEQGAAREIFEAPRHPYTQALLACRPVLDRRPARLPVIADFMDGGVRDSSGHAPRLELPERSRGVSESDPVVLEVKNLRKTFRVKTGLFGHAEVPAVEDVSFTLRRGRTLGLVGESGSGKTTVGLTVMRLHEASGGEVLFEGRDLLQLTDAEMQAYRRRIQIVFQNPYASLNPRFTVGHILAEPMQIHAIGADEEERLGIARQLLLRVGLPESALDRYPHEFSGGQRQRIAIARCLTLKPEVLICDESVSALDVSVQAQVLNLLQDLQDEFALSYIFISHDLAVVKYMSDEVMVMNQGRVVEFADSDEIYRHPRNEYTRRLLDSIPKGWTGARG